MSNVIVSSGVTSSGLAVSPHGTLAVLRGGVVVDTTVLQAGTEVVSKGGRSSNTRVFSGGDEVFWRDGLAFGDAIGAGGALTLAGDVIGSAGQSAGLASGGEVVSGVLLSNGSRLDLLSARVMRHGTATIGLFGLATDTAVLSGGDLVVSASGVASRSQVAAGATETLWQGGKEVGGTISAGGRLTLAGELVGAGQVVSAGVGASDKTLSKVILLAGAEVELTSGEVKSGGTELVGSGGSATDTTLLKGGKQQVLSGGATSQVDVLGALTVSSGGVAKSLIVESGGQATVMGSAAGAMVQAGGRLVIASGGLARSISLLSSGVASVGPGGVASGVEVFSGATLTVASGGIDSRSAIYGAEVVQSGGVASDTHVYVPLSGASSHFSASQILKGGDSFGTVLVGLPYSSRLLAGKEAQQDVYAGSLAEGTVTSSVATQLVHSGGLARDTTVHLHGVQIIESGGVAISTTLSDGNGSVEAGGAISTVSVLGRAFLAVQGTADEMVVSGGEISLFGGVARGAQLLSGAVEFLNHGGTDFGATVAAGATQSVGSTGVASASVVESGGVLAVEAGGIASGGSVASGGVLLDNGLVVARQSMQLDGALSGSGLINLAPAGMSCWMETAPLSRVRC
ncbi:MAG TPA: hypothetical protein VFE13_06120 [Caulobacteraceae bacterium]|jgi:autotransporter passenger strand-loop-strand repeat protein|nr:hypothetical protein [Caulobacteraceae bacterium]